MRGHLTFAPIMKIYLATHGLFLGLEMVLLTHPLAVSSAQHQQYQPISSFYVASTAIKSLIGRGSLDSTQFFNLENCISTACEPINLLNHPLALAVLSPVCMHVCTRDVKSDVFSQIINRKTLISLLNAD